MSHFLTEGDRRRTEPSGATPVGSVTGLLAHAQPRCYDSYPSLFLSSSWTRGTRSRAPGRRLVPSWREESRQPVKEDKRSNALCDAPLLAHDSEEWRTSAEQKQLALLEPR